MNKFFLFAMFMCIAVLGMAQEEIDIIDQNGAVVKTVNAAYCDFYHAYAVTMQQDGAVEKYSVLDLKTLKTVVPASAGYTLIEWYNHDAFGKVHTDEGVGLIDFSTGKLVVPVGAHNIRDKKGEYIMVMGSYEGSDGSYHEKTSIYNLKGEQVYTGEDRIEMTDSGTFFKKHDGSISGPYAADGSKMPNHAEYNGVDFIYFSNGYATLEQKGKEGLINEKGKLILPFEFDGIKTNSKGQIMAEKGDQIVFFNKEGQEVSPYQPSNDYMYVMLDHFVIYKANDLSGMMDFEGNKLTELRFKQLMAVGELGYYVDADGAPGVVSAQGEDLINLGDGAEIAGKGELAFAAKIDGKTGLLTINGEELIPFEYESVTHLDGDYWGASDRAGKYGIYDAKKQAWLYNMNLEALKAYYGTIEFKKDGYMGAILGDLHIPPTKYKSILSGGNGYISATR